jgi:hypothetical protein
LCLLTSIKLALLWLAAVVAEETALVAAAVADLPMLFLTLCRGRCCPLLLLVQLVRRARRVVLRLAAQFLPLRAEPAVPARVAPELLLQACVALLRPAAETAGAAVIPVAVVVPVLCMGTAVQAVQVAPLAVEVVARVVPAQSVDQAEAVAAVAVALALVTMVAFPGVLAAAVEVQRPLGFSTMVVPGWVRPVPVT